MQPRLSKKIILALVIVSSWFLLARSCSRAMAALNPDGMVAPPDSQLTLGRVDTRVPKVLLNTLSLQKREATLLDTETRGPLRLAVEINSLTHFDSKANVACEKPTAGIETIFGADLDGDGELEIILTKQAPVTHSSFMLTVLAQNGKARWQQPVGSRPVRVAETPRGVEVIVDGTSEGTKIAYDSNGNEIWRSSARNNMSYWAVGAERAYALKSRSEWVNDHDVYLPGASLQDQRDRPIAYLKTYAAQVAYPDTLTLKNARGERFLVVIGVTRDLPWPEQNSILMVYNQAQEAVYGEVLKGQYTLTPHVSDKDTAVLSGVPSYKYKLP